MFAENKIGLLGLGIIVFFALLAIAHPILMKTVWDPKIYDPVIGYDEILVEKTVVEEVTDPATEVQVSIAQLDYFHLDPEVGDTITILEQPAPPSAGASAGDRSAGPRCAEPAHVQHQCRVHAGHRGRTGDGDHCHNGRRGGGLLWRTRSTPSFMRVADLLIIMPLIPVLILMGALINLELIHLAIIIGILSGFGGTTLIIKSQALTVKVKPFIEAAPRSPEAATGTSSLPTWSPTSCPCLFCT